MGWASLEPHSYIQVSPMACGALCQYCFFSQAVSTLDTADVARSTGWCLSHSGGHWLPKANKGLQL